MKMCGRMRTQTKLRVHRLWLWLSADAARDTKSTKNTFSAFNFKTVPQPKLTNTNIEGLCPGYGTAVTRRRYVSTLVRYKAPKHRKRTKSRLYMATFGVPSPAVPEDIRTLSARFARRGLSLTSLCENILLGTLLTPLCHPCVPGTTPGKSSE